MDISLTTEPVTPAKTARCSFKLSRHAAERLLERSHRQPTWLVELLNAYQFVYLQYGKPTRKRYAFVFDAIDDTYYVAVLHKEFNRVITVLTATQYETVYGVIEKVFYQLAQLARVEKVQDASQNALASDAQQQAAAALLNMKEILAIPGEVRTSKSWRVCLKFQAPSGIQEYVRHLDPNIVQACIKAQLLKRHEETGEELGNVLDVSRQAQLLAQNQRFHIWLTRNVLKSGQRPEDLISVEVRPRVHGVSFLNITDTLVTHMA